MFGVRSGRSNCTLYVEDMNSHDPPVRMLEMYRNQTLVAKKREVYLMAKVLIGGVSFLSLACLS